MAGVTLRRTPATDLPDHQATDVSVWAVDASANESLMEELNALLRRTLAQANQPLLAPEAESRPGQSSAAPNDRWVVVAPGITVRASEYQERFGHLDLDLLKRRMSPPVFAAFVRHIGTMRGPDDVDVNDLLAGEEEN